MILGSNQILEVSLIVGQRTKGATMRNYAEIREALIDKIEGKTGALLTVPYHEIATTDLLKLAIALYPEGLPEYWEYMNQ